MNKLARNFKAASSLLASLAANVSKQLTVVQRGRGGFAGTQRLQASIQATSSRIFLDESGDEPQGVKLANAGVTTGSCRRRRR